MRSFRFLFLVAFVLFAAGLYLFYHRTVSLPASIVISSGPPNGRHHLFALGLKAEVERQLGITVHVETSQGSRENLTRLTERKADFIVFQPDTRRVPVDAQETDSRPRFVANLFSEVVQIIVQPDSEIKDALGLEGQRVSVGIDLTCESIVLLVRS